MTAGRPALEINPNVAGAEAYEEVAVALIQHADSREEDIRGAA